MNIVETYAPTLKHLEKQLRPHDPVIISWTAGPQPAERIEFCFKLVQKEMEQVVRTADPEALQKGLSDGQRQLSSLQSLKILNQLIQEVEW